MAKKTLKIKNKPRQDDEYDDFVGKKEKLDRHINTYELSKIMDEVENV